MIASVSRAWFRLGVYIGSAGLVAACTASGSTVPPTTRTPVNTSATGHGWRTTQIPSQPGSADIEFNGLACPAPDQCVAAGTYTPKINSLPFVMSGLTAGGRPTLVTLQMPASATFTDVEGLACASPAYCVAVGTYGTSTGSEAFTATGTYGHWAPARTIALPAGTAGVNDFGGVACTSPGTCVAVGSAPTDTHRDQAFVVSESGGVWGRAASISLPANMAPKGDSDLSSVACPSAGSCVAVGSYAVASGLLSWPMAMVESHGHWLRAQQIPLPADANRSPNVGGGGLVSVSCAPDGPCLAVGGYLIASGAPDHGLAVTEETGHLGQPFEMPQGLRTATCDPAFCLATANTGAMLSYSGGRWSRIASVQPPASVDGAADRGDSLRIEDAVCFAGGRCVAVGTFTDDHGRGVFIVSTRS